MKSLIFRTVSLSVLIMALGACGGGGGGGGIQPIPPAPAPAPPPPPPPPVPPPPPPPPGSGFDTFEYQDSRAAAQAKAITAYEKGATGKGVTAAIIDDSFAPTISAFAGRVHPASGDVVAGRGLDGDHHHGTAVASILGAAKDDQGIHGVAFDSTLLMLRADAPGTCTSTSPTCQFNHADLAKAFDLAVQNGARVINLSMQISPMPPILAAAIDKATAAGVVVVLSAGNSFPAGGAEPFPSALIAIQPEGRGTVIIAGATNNAGTDLAAFSHRAGSGANFYLSAVGQGLKVYDRNGTLLSGALGTSFSAPAIAGAVALLAQAFPNLTGKQIVDLLLGTATDMGAPGTDAIYGRGQLNLTGAFAPQGTLSLAGAKARVSLAGNGRLSPAMGDARGDLKAVFLDGYARAYEVDLAGTFSSAGPDSPLHSALGGGYAMNSAALGPLAVSITTRRESGGPAHARIKGMELSEPEARTARALAATALARLTPKTALALGFSEDGRALSQRLSERHGDSFVVARDPLAGSGFHGRAVTAIGIRQDFGPVAVTMTSERGEVRDHVRGPRQERSGYLAGSLVAERRTGRLRLSFGGSMLREEATILGGRFSPGFSQEGSASWFADGSASLDLGSGWIAHAGYRHGWTRIRGSDALVKGGRLASDAFAFGIARNGAFTPGDRLAFRIAQPLRVRSGGFDLYLPVSYDYATLEAGFQNRFFNLAPSGRELDYELSYGMRLWGGHLGANAFVRTDPGHARGMKRDVGAALRFSRGF